MSKETFVHPAWTPRPIATSWDDLLEGIATPENWARKRAEIRARFLELLREEARPPVPKELDVQVERAWDGGGFTIKRVSYRVEADERAHAYLALPDDSAPSGGRPGVVCLHGTLNWGARQTLRLPPEPGDPHASKGLAGGYDFARTLVRRGYATISPEHFCSAARCPAEGPYETAAFYRKHPRWSAVGKYMHDSAIALSVLAAQPGVNPARIGVTGHSLGGQGSIWLAAYDERVACSAPSCAALTFRENPEPLHWSRDYWYIYFPQLRETFLRGQTVACDFHEQFALIAPRPMLERFALNDGNPLSQAHRVMLHLKVREVYRLLGAEAAHAFLAFGDGHSIPDVSDAAMASWMDRWLKREGRPLGGRDDEPARDA
ncbi:MAG: dienelactone hydrolase family protein [Planctomycetota bacterium]|nr:dienelactone hydrolase family protein [Planctomycetota bacterium]